MKHASETQLSLFYLDHYGQWIFGTLSTGGFYMHHPTPLSLIARRHFSCNRWSFSPLEMRDPPQQTDCTRAVQHHCHDQVVEQSQVPSRRPNSASFDAICLARSAPQSGTGDSVSSEDSLFARLCGVVGSTPAWRPALSTDSSGSSRMIVTGSTKR